MCGKKRDFRSGVVDNGGVIVSSRFLDDFTYCNIRFASKIRFFRVIGLFMFFLQPYDKPLVEVSEPTNAPALRLWLPYYRPLPGPRPALCIVTSSYDVISGSPYSVASRGIRYTKIMLNAANVPVDMTSLWKGKHK